MSMFEDARWQHVQRTNQGKAKKVLVCCNANLLRSPTVASVLSSPPFNFNTRSCGMMINIALVPIDAVLIAWADEIVCMTREHENALRTTVIGKKIICLDIADEYKYGDPKLMALAKKNYLAASK
jgi:predicted protein tyrosine phosphatase